MKEYQGFDSPLCDKMTNRSFIYIFRVLAVSLFVCFNIVVKAQTTGDNITTVNDYGSSGMYFATLCPDHDVAVDKNVGDAFSIYIDLGSPFFNKLRVRGGKYNVKAGECVVFKTAEASSFEVPAAGDDIRSSLFSNDIICLNEDTSTDDFVSNHPVGDGEYIYLLTNMERNGGFGFTHFIGDIMRKGYFFIISTVKPETSAINAATRAKDNISSSSAKNIYDQRGHKITKPHAGQIYIQDGRKYIAASGGRNSQEATTIPLSHASTRADKDIEDGDPVPFLTGEAGNDDGFVTKLEISESSFVRGDANGDGEVNSEDVMVISDYIMGKPTETFVMEAADVNGDETIDAADIVGTVKIVMDETE